MKKEIIGMEDREGGAYYRAAIAIMASTLNVPYQDVGLGTNIATPGLAVKLRPFLEWMGTMPKRDRLFRSDCERYITVLMAGEVGMFLLKESRLAPQKRAEGALTRAGRHCRSASDRNNPEHDLAFALAIAWLARVDGGNAIETLRRLWRAAYGKLSLPQLGKCLTMLAADLQSKQRILSGEVLFLLTFAHD